MSDLRARQQELAEEIARRQAVGLDSAELLAEPDELQRRIAHWVNTHRAERTVGPL